jgi:hypothetical protein
MLRLLRALRRYPVALSLFFSRRLPPKKRERAILGNGVTDKARERSILVRV